MQNVRFMRWLATGMAVVAVTAAAYAGFGAMPARAQSGEAVLTLTGPVDSVKEGDAPIGVTVAAENVTNFGSFQFILLYDDGVFAYDSYQRGEFLGSTGREVVCNEVTEPGAFKLNCVSFRATPAGPVGSGALATVMLKPKGSGITDVALDRVKLTAADEVASEITVAAAAPVTIDVASSGGFNWLIWGAVIGVVAIVIIAVVVFVAMRTRSGSSGKPATAL